MSGSAKVASYQLRGVWEGEPTKSLVHTLDTVPIPSHVALRWVEGCGGSNDLFGVRRAD